MSALRDAFDERLDEVNAYLDFLALMEGQTQAGVPRFNEAGTVITPQQQKLLYASVYLQLYNLVEATMTLCVASVAQATSRDARWTPQDLSEALRKEWIRSTARTHIDLTYPKRLDAAVQVVDQLLCSDPVAAFEIESGGGGNWDDRTIEKMSHRLGCDLEVSPAVRTSIKRHVKDDLGPLALVKSMRNKLAHGSMSFTESADEVSVSQLRSLAQAVIAYLGEVVNRFTAYLDGHEFLIPERRPVGSP
jgi:hypothetical protein